MESLSKKASTYSRLSEGFLFALIFLVFLLPLLMFLGRSIVHLDAESLNSVFFYLLGRSIILTFIQAFLSTIFVSVGASFLAVFLIFRRDWWGKLLKDWTEVLGNFAVVLPGMSVALLVLDMARALPMVPNQGLFAVVGAHFILNILFLTSILVKAIERDLKAGLSEEMEAAALLGASGFKLFIQNLRNPLLQELRTWGPILFLWSFGAFSTVVVLGGGPQFSSPEVFLFYSLQNDFGSGRIFVLVLVQMALAFLLSFLGKKVRKGAATPGQRLGQRALGSINVRLYSLGLTKLVSSFLFFIFSLPLIWLSLTPFINLGAPPESLPRALGFSLLLVIAVGLYSFFLSHIVFLSTAQFRKSLLIMWGFSSTVIGAAWMSDGSDFLSSLSATWEILFVALALVLLQIPLVALWIENRRREISKEQWEAAKLLGASNLQTEWWVIRPQVKDLFIKIVFISSIGALGELSLVALIVRDTPMLSTLSQKMAAQYNFSGSSWVLLSMLVLSVLLYGAQAVYLKNMRKSYVR